LYRLGSQFDLRLPELPPHHAVQYFVFLCVVSRLYSSKAIKMASLYKSAFSTCSGQYFDSLLVNDRLFFGKSFRYKRINHTVLRSPHSSTPGSGLGNDK